MESARWDVRDIARSLIAQLQLLLRTHATESASAALLPRLPSYIGVSLHVRLLFSFSFFLFSTSAPAFLHRRVTAHVCVCVREREREREIPCAQCAADSLSSTFFLLFFSVAWRSMMLPIRSSARPPFASSLELARSLFFAGALSLLCCSGTGARCAGAGKRLVWQIFSKVLYIGSFTY